MTLNISPERIETILQEAAATHILPRFKSLKNHEISEKTGPQDLVTAADIETEAMLTDILTDEFPGSIVMGEEAVSRGEMDVAKIFADPPELLWVVDPVDGTWNFANGIETFASMLALQYKGETVMSWIYNVMKDEFAFAEKGQGAAYAGEAIRSASHKLLAQSQGYASGYHTPKEIVAHWNRKEKEVDTIKSVRCVAHTYIRLASGQMDFYLCSHAQPWDHLAGVLLLSEAGGIARRWDKAPYAPGTMDGIGLLLASNEQSWSDLHDLFLKDMGDEGH